MKKKINSKKILKKAAYILLFAVLLFVAQATNVFATEDPLAVITNLQTFIAGLVKKVGIVILILGIVQIGMSLKSHDPSQRASRNNDFSRWSCNCICTTNSNINYWRMKICLV